MSNGSRVPQLGNWENQDNFPDTVFFDKARKGQTRAQMVNLNDLEDTRSVLSDNPEPIGAAPPVSRSRNEPTQGTVQPSHERVRSREEVGMRQCPDPSPNHENMAHLKAMESEQSVDRSPLHRQAKVRDGASWEGNRSFESNEGAPAKTQMKPSNDNQSDDSFDKAAVVDGWNNNANTEPNSPVENKFDKAPAVPKFGEWNNDPTSPEGYAHIFNKVRVERVFVESSHSCAMSGWDPARSTSLGEYLAPTIVERGEKLDDKPKGCCFWFSK